MLDIEIDLAAEAGRQRYEERMQMPAVRQSMKYITEDGAEFDTNDDALAHAVELEIRDQINEFASQHGDADDDAQPTTRTITRRANLIVAWELWRREREAQTNGGDDK